MQNMKTRMYGGHKNAGTPSFLYATGCSSPIGAPCLRAAREALQSAGVVGALDQEGDDADVGVHIQQRGAWQQTKAKGLAYRVAAPAPTGR